MARLEGLTVSEEEAAEFLDEDTDDEDAEAIRDELLMDKAMDLLVRLAEIESV